jgi:NAD(P)-dependent dehydrogenase (short-subunit alcohol dehydrogenase family)
MDRVKEAIQHKVVRPERDTKEQEQAKPGLERELEPKPTKVHLPTSKSGEEGTQEAYKPSGKLAGKRAIITGGDSGVGSSVAMLFSMEGAKVAIVYLPADEADAQHTKAEVEKNGGEILLIASDLSRTDNCKDVIERATWALGGLDILVNNAAYREEKDDLADITEEQWSNTFRTNVDSYFHMTKYALPHLTQGGAIINSTSVDAYIGVPSRLDYAASKGAIVAFTRALSNQLVRRGIRVNAVASGPAWTPLVVACGAADDGRKGRRLGNSTPMGRLGQPSEIATSYVFLAAPDSAFMSGQTLHPNGGIVVNG